MIKINDEEFGELRQNLIQVMSKFVVHREESILIYGFTGEGKTTLLNCIAEVAMNGVRASLGKFKFQIDNPLEGTRAAGGIVSQTMIPSFYLNFCDTQGLGDSRGPIQEIINAFSVFTIAKNTDKIKILLIVTQNTLMELRKAKLLQVILSLGQTFQKTDELLQGLCLIVSQTQLEDPDEIREVFKEILNDEGGKYTFDIAQKKIIEHFASQKSKIVFFRSPKSCKANELIEDRKLILQAVDSIQYQVNAQPSICISKESSYLIEYQLQMVYDDMAYLIENKLNIGVRNYLEESILNHRGQVADLKLKLRTLYNELKQFTEERDYFKNNFNQIQTIAQLINRDDIQKEIVELIHRLDFIKLVRPQLQIERITSGQYHNINPILSEINKLISNPQIDFNYERKTLTVKGILMGMEDIISITSNHDFFSELIVQCDKSFFIDADLNLPGVNFTLFSPELIIVNNHVICLKGKVGENHQKASNGVQSSTEDLMRNGANGLKGLSGLSGGIFFGKSIMVHGLGQLTINVEGGNGGEGQAGGDGSQGLDGGDGGKKDVEDRKRSARKSRNKIKSKTLGDHIKKGIKILTTFNEKYEEIYQSTEPGQRGGQAGSGGQGGDGGQSGFVNIDYSIEEDQQPIIFKQQGENGMNGQCGQTGLDGKDGPTYRGIYINEYVLPQFRNKKISHSIGQDSSIIAGPIIVTTATGVVVQSVSMGTSLAVSTALKVTAKTALQVTAKTALKVAAFPAMAIAGGAFIAVQGLIISPLCAYASSKWKVDPYQVDIEAEAEALQLQVQ